ncbi:hypothetical protein [Kitasatospora sp. NPDC001175]|uniref:hypothetical protein n=1 Tax=Kitasatospora sp. NPDC001175 TaxID=3157103 RepID=UPI003CFE5105
MPAAPDDDFGNAYAAINDLDEYFTDPALTDGLLTDRRAAQAEIVDKTLAIDLAEQITEIDTDNIAVLYQLRQHAQDHAARIDLALDYVDASRLWLRLLNYEFANGLEGDFAEAAVRAKRLKTWSSGLLLVLRDAGSREAPQTAQAALAPLLDRDAILRPGHERAVELAQGKSVAVPEIDKVIALREEYADLAFIALDARTEETSPTTGPATSAA